METPTVDVPEYFIGLVMAAHPNRKALIAALEEGEIAEIDRQFALALDWNLDPKHIHDLAVAHKVDEIINFTRPYTELMKLRDRWNARDFGPALAPSS